MVEGVAARGSQLSVIHTNAPQPPTAFLGAARKRPSKGSVKRQLAQSSHTCVPALPPAVSLPGQEPGVRQWPCVLQASPALGLEAPTL